MCRLLIISQGAAHADFFNAHTVTGDVVSCIIISRGGIVKHVRRFDCIQSDKIYMKAGVSLYGGTWTGSCGKMVCVICTTAQDICEKLVLKSSKNNTDGFVFCTKY